MNDETKDPEKTARSYALAKLNRREYSSEDVRRFLIEKKVEPDVADRVIARLVELVIIDDERFSRILIREQANRGKGPMVIRQKLRVHGIRLDVKQIQERMSELTQTSEVDTAMALVERKYPNAWTDRKEAHKAIQALLRRGFSYAVAQQVLLKSP